VAGPLSSYIAVVMLGSNRCRNSDSKSFNRFRLQ